MSWWKPAVSIVLLILGIILSHLGISWFQNNWVRMAWFALAWMPTGLGVLLEAIEGVREGDAFNEFLLMSVASIGAFAIGEYPEAVAVMALYCIGEALQDRAVNRARSNISSLIAFRPDHAVVVNGDTRQTVDPAQVKVGNIVEVKTGERVPVDGTLTGEAAPFDTAALKANSSTLKSLGSHLTDTADILLYGCSTGAGEAGTNFVNTLANLTGADVAASTNDTGNATDWVLEKSVGKQADSLREEEPDEKIVRGGKSLCGEQ